jgi:hypothetical protein
MNVHQTSSLSSVATSSGFTAFVLSQMRVAFVRSRLITNEIGTIGSALRGGHIGPETALAMLHDAGLGWLTEPSS